MDRSTQIFEQHRNGLFRLAYNMLGRVSKAEDIVQETYLRWGTKKPEEIRNSKAYLSTIATRLCLDELKSARQQREKYIGPNLPEPIASSSNNPEDETQLIDSLSMAMMFLLETLNPVQRAVFILREVFNYPYAEIADIVNKSETHCRKIAQRARDQMDQKNNRFQADRETHQQLLKAFMEAVQNENIDQLESLLGTEAILYSDGGGKVNAARKPIFGAKSIARFMTGISQKAPENLKVSFSTINGMPGIMIYFGEQLQSIWTVQVKNSVISKIFVVLNPEKLTHIQN